MSDQSEESNQHQPFKTAAQLPESNWDPVEFSLLLFLHTPNGIAIYRPIDGGRDFLFIDVNPAVEKIEKLSRDRFIGRTLSELFPNIEEFGLLDVMRKTSFDGKPRHHPVSRYSDDRLIGWRSNYIFRLSCGDVMTVYEDRTEEQQKIVESDKELLLASRIFEGSSEAILITDHNANIININSAFTTITGYSRHEVIGQNPRIMQSGVQDRDFYANMWQEVIEKGYWRGEVFDRRKNGEIYPKQLTINVVYNDEQQPIYYIGIFSDLTAARQSEEEHLRTTWYDALTGLPNRALFLDRLDRAILRAEQSDEQIALLYLDLDGFKHINESISHRFGDKLLEAVAVRLRESIDRNTTLARLGGDEFSLLIEEGGVSTHASRIARRLLDRLAEPFSIDGHEIVVSSSIGISLYPIDGRSGADLLRHADRAMYYAKEQGKNNFQFFAVSLQDSSLEFLRISAALRHAIARNELSLHYQPVVEPRSGHVRGLEALLRWKHPELGQIGPDRFIPVAEESGIIGQIGNWVLEQATTMMARLQREIGVDLRIAVNLSPLQFRDPQLVQRIELMLQKSGLKGESLELEITEGALLRDNEENFATLEALKRLGVTLAIDDFGTGYSSLAYLRRLPIDTLKIDRAFISSLPGDIDSLKITRTIIAIARALNLHVVAEGIENVEQLNLLVAAGCDEIQGYYYSPPLPLDRLLELFEEHPELLPSIRSNQRSEDERSH